MNESIFKTIIILIVGIIIGSFIGYVIQLPQQTSLQNQVTSLQNQVISLQNQVSNLQTQVTSLLEDKANLQSQKTSLQVDKTNLQIENAMLKDNVTILKTQVQQLQDESTRLRERPLGVSSYIPQGITILSTNTQLWGVASYEVYGEFLYNGPSNAQLIVVCGAFFDAEGNLIDVSSDLVAYNILKEGDKAPFRLYTRPPLKAASSYVITIEWDDTSKEPYRDFQVTGLTTGIDNSGDLTLSGYVTNIGSSKAIYTKIIVTFYDSQGKVLEYESPFITPMDVYASLAPNATGSFKVYLNSALVSKYAGYSIVVDAIKGS